MSLTGQNCVKSASRVGFAFLLLQGMQAAWCIPCFSFSLPASCVHYCSSQAAVVAAFSVKQVDLYRSAVPNPPVDH